MKNQRFRIKLTALLLVGLLLLAVGYGAHHVPRSGSAGSLREAILRLTGQATSVPREESPESPSPVSSGSPPPDVSGLGSLSGPLPEDTPDSSSSPAAPETATAMPSPPGPQDSSAFPLLTPDGPLPTDTPPPVGSQSLRDALSALWESAAPATQNPE